MKADRPVQTYETPLHWTKKRFDARDRAELRARILEINASLNANGSPTIIGKLWRLERNHYFGVVAVFAVIPNPNLKVTIQ